MMCPSEMCCSAPPHLQAAQALAGQQLARDLLGRVAAHVGDHAVELLRLQVRLQGGAPVSGVHMQGWVCRKTPYRVRPKWTQW